MNQPSVTAQVSYVPMAPPFLRVCFSAVGNALHTASVGTVMRLLLGLSKTKTNNFPPNAEVKLTPVSLAASQLMLLMGLRRGFKRVKYLALSGLMQRAKNILKTFFFKS